MYLAAEALHVVEGNRNVLCLTTNILRQIRADIGRFGPGVWQPKDVPIGCDRSVACCLPLLSSHKHIRVLWPPHAETTYYADLTATGRSQPHSVYPADRTQMVNTSPSEDAPG